MFNKVDFNTQCDGAASEAARWQSITTTNNIFNHILDQAKQKKIVKLLPASDKDDKNNNSNK